jgi:hypothetical protein
MDLVDLTKEIDKLNNETIPRVQLLLDAAISDLHTLLDRLNNATATITFTIPPREQ